MPICVDSTRPPPPTNISTQHTNTHRYTEHEFDHEFIEELSKAIYHFVKTQRKPPSLAQIADHVRTSGVSKVRRSFRACCLG